MSTYQKLNTATYQPYILPECLKVVCSFGDMKFNINSFFNTQIKVYFLRTTYKYMDTDTPVAMLLGIIRYTFRLVSDVENLFKWWYTFVKLWKKYTGHSPTTDNTSQGNPDLQIIWTTLRKFNLQELFAAIIAENYFSCFPRNLICNWTIADRTHLTGSYFEFWKINLPVPVLSITFVGDARGAL